MSDFELYFQIGLSHIADLHAYDHMLFVVSLCALFQVKDWKKVLILVTAFTIGHSITLALSVLDFIKVNSDVIETLIPITIFLTSIYNILQSKKGKKPKWMSFHYGIALSFGLIHGMGFANYLKALLGGSEGIGWPLFSFNVGIEIGQIGIVILYFILYYIISTITKVKHSLWVILISIFTAIISIRLLWGVIG